MENGFDQLGLDAKLVAALAEQQYTEPTPIQRDAIPPALTGRDVIGLAGTGTGKTAAFALPMIHRIAADAERGRPSGLVLVPTRELASQVATAITRYSKPLKLKVTQLYGGAPFNEQVRELRREPDIVVATPGRALDHLRKGTLELDETTVVVLDEADEMLDMGFADDLEAILDATPDERQTMFFSATMPPRTAAVAARHLKNPLRVAVAAAPIAKGEAPLVRHTAFVVRRDHKIAALVRVLDFESPTSAIVFCRTRVETEAIAEELSTRGLRPESLHGGLTQEQRERVMRQFRDGATTVLVATDVAARGLDIGHLSHIVNFGLPESTDLYVHRTGRVGRAGREGVALTIVEPREQHALRQIERATGKPIAFERVPNHAMVNDSRVERTRAAIRELLIREVPGHAAAIVAPLVAEFGAEAVAVAAIAKFAGIRLEEGNDIFENAPPPMVKAPRAMDRPRRANMARLFVGVGRMSGVGRRDLVDAFSHQVGLDSRDIGAVEITERFSLVEVPGDMADRLIQSLHGFRLKGRNVEVRRDRWSGPAV